MIIAIASCEAHRDREKAIRDTWGNHQVRFFYGEPSDYLHLPEKMKNIFTELQEEDWVFKTDSDSYVNITRLLASGYEQYDYSGYTRTEWSPTYCYGPGYWVSHKAMKILAQANWDDYRHPQYPDAEDVMVGMVLSGHGIKAHHDERYGHFIPVLKGNSQILQHLSSRKVFQLGDMYLAHERFTHGD